MDLKPLIPVIASLAPMAGSILGGLIPFPGGSIIGQKFGEIIAKQFGLPATATASQVSDAIVQAGEETARAKINAALEQARAEIDGFVAYERAILEAQVKNLSDVNATIRLENESRVKLALAGFKEHWFFSAWRPAFGWAFITVWLAFGAMLTVVTAIAAWRSPDPMAMLKEAWPLFASYFGPGAAVLGVLIPSRSYEKGEAMKAGVPMPNAKPPVPTPAPTTTGGVKVNPVAPKPSTPIPQRPVTARADG